MKPVLTKEDVQQAMNRLAGLGRKVTLGALHAALDHRGSMSTLVRLKAEIGAAEGCPADSPEALKSFRELWAAARNEGRNEQEQVIAELRETITALAAENERLEGLLVALHKHVADLETERSKADAELSKTTAAMRDATAQAARALQELSDCRAVHASELAALQAELSKAKNNAHECELQLVRARTLLGAEGFGRGQLEQIKS